MPGPLPTAAPQRASIVLTVGTGGSGQGVVLGVPGAAPATGELDLASMKQLGLAVGRALRPPAGLLLADSDVHAAARERDAAQALAAILDQPGLQDVRDALLVCRARTDQVVLVIDARTPALRALPWELLAGLPPGRSPLAVSQVLRLLPAPPPAAPAAADGLELRLWLADPDDPVTAGVAAALRARVADLPGLTLRLLPPDLAGAPQRPGPAVLHLLTHGQAALDRVGLAGGDGARSAETVTRALGSWASGCLLAVTDVCGGAQATGDPADAPTWRLAMGGPPVVVGPRTRWGGEASVAFSGALYAGLSQGLPIGDAIEEGRLALRMLAVAHDSCRWWTPLTILSTPAAAGLRLTRPPVTLPGWPRGGPDTKAVLRDALDRARGYLGIEHLLAALADPAAVLPDSLASVRPALAEVVAALPPRPLAGPARPTPRLSALGAELGAGFDLGQLGRHLAMVPWVAAKLDPAARARLLAPPTDDGRGTLPLEPIGTAERPPVGAALVLEVEAGPEDGRLLVLRQPGDVVGRWDPGHPDVRHNRLQCDRTDADRTLSRQHLTLQDDRQILLRGATRLVRAAAPPRTVLGPLLVQPGDLLVVGAGTRLRAL